MFRRLAMVILTMTLLLTSGAQAGAKFAAPPPRVTVQGLLLWETELEGPHWHVNGVVLVGYPYDLLKHLEEQEVIVHGYYTDYETIYQRPTFHVESIQAAEKIELVGEVKYDDIEGGRFSVNGWALAYDRGELERLVGQVVRVIGSEAQVSIYGGPTLIVETIEVVGPPGDGVEPRPLPPPEVRPVEPPVLRPLPRPSIWVKGNQLELSVETGLPVLVNGRYLVPLRAIAEALGAGVTYEPETGRVFISTAERAVMLKPGSLEVLVDGRAYVSEVAPQLMGGRTLVPLRLLSEGLGWTVIWDPETEMITIEQDLVR